MKLGLGRRLACRVFLSNNLLSFDSVPGIQLLRVRQRLHGFQHGPEKFGQFPAQHLRTLLDDFPVAACDSVMANEEPDDEAKTACRNLGQALA